MAAEIVQIDTQNFTSQTYGGQDTNLISSFEVNTSLSSSSYIEYFVYDNNQNILSTDYNFIQYTVLADGQSAGSNNTISQIIIDPEKSLADLGYSQGEYVAYFNFFNKQIGSNLQQLYITEISSDRTEIRLDSTTLTEFDIVEQTNSLIQQREDSPYFLDFYLNFGDNQLSIANNIQLDDQDPLDPTILIKLYEALPEEFDINSTLWIVTLVEEPIAYQVIFPLEPIEIIDTINLKGPNFNLELKDQINNSTVSLDYTNLTTTSLTSSFNQLSSLLEEKEIDINIDYTNFNEFVHFSSVETRLENFYYKMSLLEDYSSSIAVLNTTTNNNPSASLTVYESLINNIITNFDGYEYYLYYSSGSWAWPKTTSQPPYQLATTGSAAVNTWYDNIIVSASNFDNINQNNLYYAIPEYLRNDPANAPYQIFVEMMGQFYDNIWIYYKDVTQKYNADNRLEYGVSKDIVADAIRDFGIKLYQNNFSNDDLYTAFIGLTPQGGLFPFPNITGSLPTPSGFEYINTLISASNDYMPLDDVNKSLYKRIYHNLPYLLKAKGTIPGLRSLITSYGVPDTVLRINEYGGKDKSNTNDWDYWENTFNYAYHNTGSNSITTSWPLSSSWNSSNNVPSTLEFRFKVPNLSTISGSAAVDLWQTNTTSKIRLRYTGSGLASSSYSGSIIDPYYQFTHLDFFPNFSGNPTLSASVYLPFANEGWWSVMATRNGNNFGLYAGNNIYEGGENGTQLGFYTTSSATVSSTAWTTAITSQFMPQGNEMYLQEIRYYNTVISESIFKDYIMNPSSIEGNSLNSASDQLAFRLTLGGELYTGSRSIHPKITGSWSATSSFATNSSASFASASIFVPNTEYFFYDQPAVGIKNAISDKIRIENSVIPTGSVLSPFRSLAQNTAASQSYTANTNLLEVAFSPQDEINQDIMDQIGYFNIGEFIGDPRLRSSSATSYPALDNLRNAYFEKYTKNYDLNDFMRLIKFFDNSLFKMIKDFVPARTSLASGVVIKQHLLERNKYPQPQVEWEDLDISGTLKPAWNDYQPGTVENFDGGAGGVFNTFNTVTNTSQSWYETIPTLSGSVIVLHNSQDEFYDGEFSGSTLIVTTQSLAQAYPLENLSFDYTPVRYSPLSYGLPISSTFAQDQFLNFLTVPNQGEILLLRPWFELPAFPWQSSITGPAYIKMHKFDNNGVNNTIPLGQATKILIKYSTLPNYSTLNILTVSEYPTYYLYEVNNLGSNTVDDYILNYSVSASQASSFIISPTPQTLVVYNSTTGNTTGYFNSTTGIYSVANTPNITLLITGSMLASGSGTGKFDLMLNRQGTITSLETNNFTAGTPLTISASYYGLNGDQIYLRASRVGGTSTLVSGSFLITQSTSPSAKEFDPIIIEPYITLPNYYNSDYNPLINNVLVDRLSSIYQDVDYSTGITTPTNFGVIISGSAIKAAIQDSNYSSKRVILPRYEGSKSTSQHLNYWTPGDEGTYGKLPTVENLKTAVAYCDSIGGWPPERENASAIFVKYLIKADGTVIIPNTSENSLAEIKGNFESGENILISTKTVSSGQPQQLRKIIRGGSRIEPILYTQYGQAPNVTWNTTMSFTDIIPSNNGTVGNYMALYGRTGTSQILAYDTPQQVIINQTTYGTPVTSNAYTIPLNAVQDGVQFNIDANIRVRFATPVSPGSSYKFTVTLYIYKNSSQIYNFTFTPETIDQNSTVYKEFSNPTQVTLTAGNYTAGDTISAYIEVDNFEQPVNAVRVFNENTSLKISQYPAFTLPVTSSGTNSIWNWPNSSSYPYVIASSQTTLVNLYGDPNVKMVDITGSGFNPVESPWSIKYGDEFKFEGREDFVYQVGKIFGPAESGSGRIFQTGSIEVHFNANLPISASPAIFNLDHFAIRRYTDDASQVIMEGFKPTDSSGPYIVRPEFVVPELNKSVDQFILDLTQKGLIT